MKIAVSNIAWTNDEEEAVAKKLQELGVKYIELAPTKKWADPTSVSKEEAVACVDWWKQYGITPVAFQSMLFTRPDLKLFESPENRAACEAYLKKFITLAGYMDVGILVFGSPKNRQRLELAKDDADSIAKEFFGSLGAHAEKNNTCFCIEPNAKDYACDFVTNAQEGIELVSTVANPGFGLHLDAACMTMAGDDLGASIRAAKDVLRHFHISAPFLEAVTPDTTVTHAAAAQALRDIDYQGYVSIEMKPGEAGTNLDRVETAITFAQDVYRA